jgi:DMSO/TMAO reductase YedYZ molybdopterin-dependent catalytic subunit
MIQSCGFQKIDEDFQIPGKDGLIVLNDRPLNAETPPHLLDDDITPANRFFIRNNGIRPVFEVMSSTEWKLEISGESCETPTTFTLSELQQKFENVTLQLQLEFSIVNAIFKFFNHINLFYWHNR